MSQRIEGDSNSPVERYLSGSPGDRAEEAGLEREILQDEQESEELYQDVSAHSTLLQTGAGRKSSSSTHSNRPPLRRKRTRISRATPILTAAVAATVAFLYLMPGERPETTEEPVFRSESSDNRFGLFEPTGIWNSMPTEFSWSPDFRASFYRVDFRRPDATLLLSLEVRDNPNDSRDRVQIDLDARDREALIGEEAVEWRVTSFDRFSRAIEKSPWNPILIEP